jgi:DNA-binding transcriptional regulator LsrR (DeoR family)
VKPPSTVRLVPVTILAASLAKNSTADATSSGSAKRRIGICFLCASPLGLFQAARPKSVNTTVGETAFTRIQVAKEVGLTQVAVSRLLKHASELRIIRTTVVSPPGTFTDMEELLQKKFDLKQAIIAEASRDAEEPILNAIGSSAAYFVETVLKSDEIIGISSWSSSLLAMVDHMHPVRKVERCSVVQLQGGVGNPSAEKHAYHLAARLARLVHGEVNFLPAPGVVASTEAMQVLLKDPSVIQATQQYDRVTMALLGIGATQPSDLLLRSGNVYSAKDIVNLQNRGAVGEIAGHFFDSTGKIAEPALSERVFGIPLSKLHRITHSVGIAGGERKVKAIIAALHGRYINVLVTDQFTAEKILQITT